MEHKGWIALDIDGTITLDKYSVPKSVRDYLRGLVEQGWRVVIATGRTRRFALMALSEFDFPYLILTQNGSAAFAMPEKKMLFKRYLAWNHVAKIEAAFEGLDSDFVIYTGVENDDLCYYRPHRFSPEETPYLEAWQDRQKEKWVALKRFSPEVFKSFPFAKGFGSFEKMRKVSKRLQEMGAFQSAVLRDPFDGENAILLITEKGASKGLSLAEVLRLFGHGPIVIAAGDDENDVSLLHSADVKIAMSHAPEFLQEIADFIAPPVQQQGIIEALQWAIRNGKRS